jgi:hypothetical protein
VFWNFSTFAAIVTDGLTKRDCAKWFLFVVEQKNQFQKVKKTGGILEDPQIAAKL